MVQKHRFALKVKSNNDKVFLRLSGDLNGSGACQMEYALESLQNSAKGSRLTVDFSGVRHFDYFGVVQSAKAIRRQRYRFLEISLTGLEATAENLFKRFGLASGKVTRGQL
jgi:ABC-type transporter Mla MlaB component